MSYHERSSYPRQRIVHVVAEIKPMSVVGYQLRVYIDDYFFNTRMQIHVSEPTDLGNDQASIEKLQSDARVYYHVEAEVFKRGE